MPAFAAILAAAAATAFAVWCVVGRLHARAAALDELRLERDRFAALISSQHDGVAVVSPGGLVCDVNPAFCRITGYSRDEVVGLSPPFPFIADDSQQAAAEHVRRAAENRSVETDLTFRRKDGTAVAAIVATTVIRDPRGRNLGRVTQVKDVSERQRIDEQKRRHDERLAALLESAPDGVVICDGLGSIQLVNSQTERMFGYTRGQLVGRPVEVLIPARARRPHAVLRAGYLADPVARKMGAGADLTGRRSDGGEFPVDVALSTMDTDDGRLLTAFVRDATAVREHQVERERLLAELRRRADDLARSNAELEEFAYVASHDLAEPLRSISGFTQLLERRYGGRLDADADRFIGFVVDGVSRMDMLISDLLTYSRAGRLSLNVQRLELGRVVDGLLRTLHPAIHEAGARVVLGDLGYAVADEPKLAQVLQNLIANALKFRHPDRPPVIEIAAEPVRDDWQMISVVDNGIGIAPAHTAKVFKMFQRLHGRDDYPGTGIGLAVCQRIVERHGGRIWCEPGEGQGTAFRFTLPVVGDLDHRETRNGITLNAA